ncbi:hypothetical protein NBRC116494_23930 [Aurantivibrio plasticivorans]
MKKATRAPEAFVAGFSFDVVTWSIVAAILLLVVFQPLLTSVLLVSGTCVFFWRRLRAPDVEGDLKALRDIRHDLGVDDLQRALAAKGVEEDIVRKVYDLLQQHIPCEHEVPLQLSDKLHKDLHLDDDVDLIEEAAQATGRSLSRPKRSPYYGKVTTVENLILFLNYQPKLH